MLQSLGSQRVGHSLVTEQQQPLSAQLMFENHKHRGRKIGSSICIALPFDLFEKPG